MTVRPEPRSMNATTGRIVATAGPGLPARTRVGSPTTVSATTGATDRCPKSVKSVPIAPTAGGAVARREPAELAVQVELGAPAELEVPVALADSEGRVAAAQRVRVVPAADRRSASGLAAICVIRSIRWSETASPQELRSFRYVAVRRPATPRTSPGAVAARGTRRATARSPAMAVSSVRPDSPAAIRGLVLKGA